jgi:hypothetical protein
MNHWPKIFIVAASVALVALSALAQRASPTDTATALSETLSPPQFSDGWCVPTNGTTTLALHSLMPARITAAMQAKIRIVEVRFVAGTTSTRLCTRLGGALPAASCDTLDTDAQGILFDGNVRTLAIARDFRAGDFPTLQAQANAGTDGAACVTVWW